MSHITDAYNYYIATGNPGNIVFSTTPKDVNNWIEGNHMGKHNYQGELNFRVEDVENGFILSLGSGYNNCGGSHQRFVFNTIKELNDFIAKTNEEELS